MSDSKPPSPSVLYEGKQEQPERLTAKEILRSYAAGRRYFHNVLADNVNIRGCDLQAARFYGASLRGANLSHSTLTHVQFKAANLVGADISDSWINASDLIGANLCDVDFRGSDFTGAILARANCTGVDFRGASFGGCQFGDAILRNAKLESAKLFHTHFDDTDLRPFCDSVLQHNGPSFIDSRAVMKSFGHPGLKQFMIDCGVPDVFAEYMIDCARAITSPLLARMMQSTFISYGAPDESFARRLYDALRAHSVIVFFFPETAKLGERIGDEVFRQLQEHDRALLVCSKDSLDRPGVVNEIQETLDREARDGGATYLLPIMLDDYVLKGWKINQPVLAERVSRRIIGDFRGTKRSKAKFNVAVGRLVDALKLKKP